MGAYWKKYGVVNSNIKGYTPIYSDYSAKATHTIDTTNYIGKKLLLIVWRGTSVTMSQTYFDNSTCTGGTLTKIDNLTNGTDYGVGTVFLLVPTSNSCVLSTDSKNSKIKVYLAE